MSSKTEPLNVSEQRYETHKIHYEKWTGERK